MGAGRIPEDRTQCGGSPRFRQAGRTRAVFVPDGAQAHRSSVGASPSL